VPITVSFAPPSPVPVALTGPVPLHPGDHAVERSGTGAPMVVRAVAGDRSVATESGRIWPAGHLQRCAPPGDPVPAGLTPTGQVAGAGGRHLLIRGENAHAAAVLEAEHGPSFDLIYLDPPYDTGTQLSYADSRDDWADFFHARLVRAARLLRRPSGVVIIAIDDRRLHWARLIADEVLGTSSFVANVVWDGGVKGQSRLVSVAHDYMLIYVADPDWYKAAKVKWREPKPGTDQVLAAARRLWDGDPASSRQKMVAWFKTLSPDNPARALYLYCCFTPEGRLFREGPVSRPGGDGYRYDVIHPVTGEPVVPPAGGWRYSQDRMAQMLAAGRIQFRADHTTSIASRLFLDEQTDQVASSVFTEVRTRAAKRLAARVGPGKFTYPKDPTVLARWFALATRNDPQAKVLDLFAGSGATGEAVMAMNAADGGRRTSVCVTNNEVSSKDARELEEAGVVPGSAQWEARGVFEQVTRPRLEIAAAEYGEHLDVADLTLGAGPHLLDGTGLVAAAAETKEHAAA